MGPGKWRHMSCLDVDMQVVKVTYRGPTYVKCKVLWLNRNYNDLLLSPRPETVTVQKKDLWKWSYVR